MTSANPPRSARRTVPRPGLDASPEIRGWCSRGYLPHLDAPGLIQHLTFHLADSLPAAALERMEAELGSLPEPTQTRRRRERIQGLLDAGLGSCVLRHDECARVVEESFTFGDSDRYRLLGWCIMPNHVHVLIEQTPDWPLAKVIQSWKRHSSREIHRLALRIGLRDVPRPLWQREYWDRYVRDARHLEVVKRYIENNPVAAGLVDTAESWPWGSARFRRSP